MAKFVPGQQVRIKTIEELCEEFDYTAEEIVGGVMIGNISTGKFMEEYGGRVFTVSDVDTCDGTVFINATECWFSFDMVVQDSDPDCLFGFRVGDYVEFRQYDDMRDDGSIEYNWFTDAMKVLCGTRGTIIALEPVDGCMAKVVIKADSGIVVPWSIDTTMIEHVDDSPEISVDDWSTVALQ